MGDGFVVYWNSYKGVYGRGVNYTFNELLIKIEINIIEVISLCINKNTSGTNKSKWSYE